MLNSKLFKKGFTLIELLIVISIIGILAALSLVSFTASQKQARDTSRKSDIKQYQTALEGFANKNNGLYPERPDPGVLASLDTGLCGDISLSSCPEDPKSKNDDTGTFVYKYQSNGTASSGDPVATNYILWAKLENSTDYWVVCSDGRAGAVPQAGFGVSGGNCPL